MLKVNAQKLLLTFSFLLFLTILASPAQTIAQDFPDVCQQPENILSNCNFNNGLDGWQPFLETGVADITVLQGGGECHAPLCPAAYIVTKDHFIGGIYQQVPVTPGRNYYANIVWLVFDSLVNDEAVYQATGGINRQVGIDPFGGTDPASPNVVWSPSNTRNDCKICNVEQVTVTAQADTITVFLRLDDTWKVRAAEKGFPVPPTKDQFWIDDLGLKEVGGEPIVVQEPPTDTPLPSPPTDTPEPEIPTETPVSPTDTPTPQIDTPVSEPVSPIATPEPTNTPPLAPPTLTPTHTRTATHTAQPKPSKTPTPPGEESPLQSTQPPEMMGAIGLSILVGGTILVTAGIVMAGLIWLYRVGWRNTDKNDFDDEGIIIHNDT